LAVDSFVGTVIADEPQAAMIGRDILVAGGTAADAAAATYFALAVTMPSSAALGGGGMCLSYRVDGGRIEALDFVARPSATPGAAAVPAVARGMFSLQARDGRLRWSQVVAPAEGLARFGVSVSRALAKELAAAPDVLAQEPEAKRIFFRPDGTPLREGDRLVQPDLATVLGALRTYGPAALENGPLASQFASAAAAVGATFTPDEIGANAPSWRGTVAVRHENVIVHFAPPPAVAGVVEAQTFAMLAPRWRRAPAEERAHLFIQANLRAIADRQNWLAPDLSSTRAIADIVGAQHIDELMATYRADQRNAPVPASASESLASAAADLAPATTFVAVDRRGNTVVCAVSLHAPFGIGRIAPGTGVFLAAAPDGDARSVQTFGPMLAVRARSAGPVFAGAASGGWAGASALIQVALQTIVDDRPRDQAKLAPRVHAAGNPDHVFAEPTAQGPVPGLASRGYNVTTGPSLGRVNALYCPEAFDAPGRCDFSADRRGDGLAARG